MINTRSILLYAFLIIAGIFIPVFFVLQSQAQSSDKTQIKSDAQPFLDFKKTRLNLPIKEETVELIAVGDVMLSRTVAKKMHEYSFNYPFQKTIDYLKTGDIVFGNLECPIIKGRTIQMSEMRFRADPGVETTLKNAGFTVLSLANNHMPDFGILGINNTIALLDKAGIYHSGAGLNISEAFKPAIIECKGLKFAFFSFNDSDCVPDSYEATENHHGTAIMNIEQMTKSISEADKIADFIVVSMHSGYEYKAKPNEHQINFAHAAIDAGADLVIGHHPHWVQNIEKYKDKYILYSLGNFVFDQMWSQDTREGLTAKFFITKKGVRKIEFMPVLIENYSQPRFIDSPIADKILDRLQFNLKERKIIVWDDKNKTFIEQSRKVIYEPEEKLKTRINKIEHANLDNDRTQESYFLKDGQLWIFDGVNQIWKSQDNWWIDGFSLADSNHDGINDINMSVWREGDFGSSKPFWIDENDMSIKNHFFVFDIKADRIIPVWQSSNLENPNREFCFYDIDNDGRQELVVIEGTYEDDGACGEYIAIWRWNSWGFFNEWRSTKGKYINLSVETVEGKKYILTDSINVN